MKIVIWLLAATLLATGTVLVGVAAWAADWLAGTGELITRGAVTAADAIASLELPRWMAWLDPAWVRPLQDLLAGGAVALGVAAPWLGPLLGWVAPALWIAWLVVGALVVALAAVLHHLAGRLDASARAARPAS